jgi:hypothetical protein
MDRYMHIHITPNLNLNLNPTHHHRTGKTPNPSITKVYIPIPSHPTSLHPSIIFPEPPPKGSLDTRITTALNHANEHTSKNLLPYNPFLTFFSFLLDT